MPLFYKFLSLNLKFARYDDIKFIKISIRLLSSIDAVIVYIIYIYFFRNALEANFECKL